MNGNVCITVYILIEDIARVLLITFEGSFIEEKKIRLTYVNYQNYLGVI